MLNQLQPHLPIRDDMDTRKEKKVKKSFEKFHFQVILKLKDFDGEAYSSVDWLRM